MSAKINADTCTACGACADACPSDAIIMKSDFAEVDSANCMDCGICIDECPVEAITIE